MTPAPALKKFLVKKTRARVTAVDIGSKPLIDQEISEAPVGDVTKGAWVK
jgi:hypothetical protein